jgi:uncharacterized protein
MTMPPQLCIVTLAVADLARAEGFYSGLGWRRADQSIDGVIVWYDLGGGTYLGLFDTEELAADAALPSAERGRFDGVTLAINVGSPAEVDAALAAAVEAGGTLTKPGTATEWGGYSGYVADPDGHLWEVAHNPGFPLRPEGGIEIT